ncbi:MAG TPA: stage II sporulation protein M [Candidatus Acidoferrales bacterium]|nr:stage II sporulation protein M [Candidatus Acidoferrales bacterium]
MISTRWLEKRKPYWERLEQLTGSTGRRSIRSLAHREIQELALLYRQAASDLSRVREDPTGTQLALYLNQLLGRAHNLIYLARTGGPRGIARFYRDEYPRVFRRMFPNVLGAFAVFAAGAAAGLLLTLANPAFARYLLGPEMLDTIARHQMWTQSIVTVKPLASSAILTNNLFVSFFTFALGITAGLGTLWMLALNGLLFGVVNVACWNEGMLLPLWSFVAPHGVLELPAIFIAGGAGLEIARGMLFPGWLTRRASLEQAGARGARLVLGAIPLLLVAGTVEGFVSPSDIPVVVKFLLAAALAALLALYLAGKFAPVRAGAQAPTPEAARV